MTSAPTSTLTSSTPDLVGREPAAPRSPRRRASSRRSAPPSTPLGSLTQGGAGGLGAGSTCSVCDSTSVTHLSMTLTDGTPARFTSCRRCGERRWDGSGQPLSIAEVLARATKG